MTPLEIGLLIYFGLGLVMLMFSWAGALNDGYSISVSKSIFFLLTWPLQIAAIVLAELLP